MQRQIVLGAQSGIDRVPELGLEPDQLAEQLLEIFHQSDSKWIHSPYRRAYDVSRCRR
ncbi:MAG TPA: hypothetical protein VMF09_16595 [Solirubrobacteraceae bacterium]|nr:hypothetical protein [Solirubrobacteraceae bacterium]